MRARGIILQIIVMIIGMIKGFISLNLLVGMSNQTYAVISMFLVVTGFCVQLILLNFDAPLVSSLTKNDNQDEIGLFSVTIIIIINSFILMTGFYFLSNKISISIWNTSEYSNYVMQLAFYIFIVSLNLRTLLVFQAEKKFDHYGVFQIGQQLFQLMAIAIGVYNKKLNTIVDLLIVGELLIFIISCCFSKKDKKWINIKKISDVFEWIKNSRKMAFPLLASFFMIWIITNSGRFIVIHQLGINKVAQYNASLALAVLSGLIINPICTVFFPFFTSSKNNKTSTTEHMLVEGQLFLIVLITLASISIISLSKQLICFLAKPELYAGAFFFCFICIGQLFYGSARLTSLYYSVNGKPKYSMHSFVVGALTMLIGGVTLVYEYGIIGVSIAFCLSSAMAFLYFYKSMSALIGLDNTFRDKFTYVLVWVVSLFFMILSSWVNEFNFIKQIFFLLCLCFLYLFLLLAILWDQPIGMKIRHVIGGKN